MTVSPEELAAFADGELTGEDKARVAEAIARDPELARKVEAHRSLKAKLSAHFAPIAEQEVPARFRQMLGSSEELPAGGAAEVVDFAQAREKRAARRFLPGWGMAGGAIAASLVAIMVFSTGNPGNVDYVEGDTARALDTQLAASQPADADTRILLSFRNGEGELCRAYSSSAQNGIACRDGEGWRSQLVGEGSEGEQGEYRMAGSQAEVLEAAQEMAVGGALTAEQEADALEGGWRD